MPLDEDERLALEGLTFVWSRAKAAANRRKHRVTFEEAAGVFAARSVRTASGRKRVRAA